MFNRYADEKTRQDEQKYQDGLAKQARDKRANFEYMKSAYDSEIKGKIPSHEELQR